jgi:hypothetical protein
VAYARQLHDQSDLPAGGFETQFTFAQVLTESAKLAKNCLLVISLPASDTGTGIVHYAEYADLPGKKLWTWGVDAEGLNWRDTLSDNHSAYAEVQAGLFRDQETYGFLPPQGTVHFSEYWMPVRDIGGITRANLHGVLYLHREGSTLAAALNVNHDIPGARIRILDGANVLFEVRQDLSPAVTFKHTLTNAPAAKCRFEVSDSAGTPLLAHTLIRTRSEFLRAACQYALDSLAAGCCDTAVSVEERKERVLSGGDELDARGSDQVPADSGNEYPRPPCSASQDCAVPGILGQVPSNGFSRRI